MSFRRLAAYGGIGAVVLLVLNIILLGNQPLATDSIEEIVDYLRKDIKAHKLGFIFGLAVVPFFALFLAGVVTEMRATDREHNEGWAIVTLSGGILLAAAAGVGEALLGALFFRGGSGLDPAIVRALYDAQAVAFASTGVAMTALVGGVAASTLLHRREPAWYGWLSALVAALGILTLVGIMSRTTGVYVLVIPSFFGLIVWTLVTSVLMLRSPSTAST